MNLLRFDSIARTVADDQTARRGFLQGLAGLAMAGGLAPIIVDDADARKRKKKRKKKKKGKGGNDGGNDCQLTLCGGRCVDLDTDPNNCGICENSCDDEEGETCVEGQCVAVFGSQGSGEGQFQDPTGIALSDDDVFVTDTGNDRLVFLEGGEFDKANFAQPGPLAIANNGQFFVTDLTFEGVVRLAADGSFENSFFGQDGEEGRFVDPRGVATDPFTGRVFVADTGKSRIQIFNAIGQPLGLFGEPGDGDGELSFPRALVISGNKEVIVADTANNRIQVFDRDGTFVRAFGSEGSGDGQFSTPEAVAVDGDNNIFVVDQENNRVQQFTSDGRFVRAFGRPGSALGEFDGPTGIAIDPTGVIFVVDRGNHRVQRFRPPGTGVKAGKRRASRKGRDGSRS
jgi:sugar lactone lactonase YvrE